MAFNFANLQPEKKSKKLVDPIELFQSLRVNDSSVNDLWLAQGDALRDWHKKRDQRDIAVSLNTGAGKTLVGLLMAQSLVNETRGLVLYACSSIQLVRQTEAKALGYGLPITTYVSGDFSNELANSGEAACITTYQALFNGRSVFANREIAGIIFDDAHAAEHLLRDHFTLQLKRDLFPQLYTDLTALFRDYFHRAGKASSFDEVVDGRLAKLLLVHPAETRGAHHAILSALRAAKVDQEKSSLFAWAHLKDHIDLCAFLLSGESITITPPFLPVRILPYFARRETRRIYLSATFTGEDAFIRTFGRRADTTIAPTTTAGECERMILIPSLMPGAGDDLALAQQAIAPHKALI
ncbi:MAG: DEAD/DEAH box helicase family protein, partial [Pseudomonadota bacterium]